MPSLDDFLRTGALGPLAVDRTIEEVRDALGEPDDISSTRWPRIWRYGPLQLSFHRETREEVPSLILIAVYFRHSERLPDRLGLSGWYPAIGCTYSDFLEHLAEAGIAVSVETKSEPSESLVVGPGIRVTFDEGMLDSIQYASKRESSRKQFTVSVPSEALNAIRTEARAQGISIAALCSRWIEEKVGHFAPIEPSHEPA